MPLASCTPLASYMTVGKLWQLAICTPLASCVTAGKLYAAGELYTFSELRAVWPVTSCVGRWEAVWLVTSRVASDELCGV
jgi:hypothetical protein